MLYTKIKSEWFSNVRGDLLAGTVVALALIPETIAFSIIARSYLYNAYTIMPLFPHALCIQT